jgi:hypothetical protein
VGRGADGDNVPRIGRTLLVCAALLCALTGAARAGQGLLVGVADDTLKWSDKPTAQRALNYSRDLGLRAVRVTVPWTPGQTRLGVLDRGPIDRMILATWGGGLRVVLGVYGDAGAAPQTAAQREAYCQFVASLLHRYPGVRDIVIWNEPNSGRFWRPQFAPDGTSLAPAAYEALLARCWDVLHLARPGVNVIAASAPRGNDNPRASWNISHSPVIFYRKLGQAYRLSGRRLPIFDTVGHNPYPVTNAERPWARHTSSTTISEGDYDKLIGVLQETFGGTAQPLPGQRGVSIWYMEQGFQTAVDRSKSAFYRGRETDVQLLPPFFALAGAGTTSGLARDQATQLSHALQLAYCQPAVGAFFNFELADETNLAGWQSGVLWSDLTPKPSYVAFRSAVQRVASGRVDCGAYARLSAETGGGIGFTESPKRPSQTSR